MLFCINFIMYHDYTISDQTHETADDILLADCTIRMLSWPIQ